ncbi:MAG: ABC transporter permease subunit [Desulfobacteraceae bacterium]|nr:ABC transporter permease subunit [Desulfobacteraceae bacterium]
MKIIRNPVTRKRLARFRKMKRAYLSFWLLVILYGLSLVAELLCNSSPLYVSFEGSSYFPVFQYCTEDEFTGSGRHTRPDYKVLAGMPVFADNPGNFMIFAPHPYGPYESVTPESLPVEREVTIRFIPAARTGSVDISRNLSIVRTRLFPFFAGTDKQLTKPAKLTDYMKFPDSFFKAVKKRFENQPAPYETFIVENRAGEKYKAVLAEYKPRDAPPKTIRVLLKEPSTKGVTPKEVVIDRNLEPAEDVSRLWGDIEELQRQVLISLAEERFDAPVSDYRVVVDGRQFVASFEKTDVQFPFPPVAGHPMGLDSAGRDVLARVLYGLRIALSFGLLLVGCSMMLGVAAGAVQGYYGGRFDITSQRLVEIWNALPFLYVMILMGSIYGRSFGLLLVCYGLFNWIGISYYIRAEFLSLRKRPFVEAAMCMGVPSYKIIFKHILPNALVPVITFFPFLLVGAIGALAALDYLGFGLPPPTPSWGEMLFQAQQYRWAWWLIVYPSLSLFVVMLLGVFVGEGVRNAYDPKEYTRYE